MTTQTGLPMSWSEWFALDAIDLADLIRKGKITANEVVAQATAGVQRVVRHSLRRANISQRSWLANGSTCPRIGISPIARQYLGCYRPID